MRRATCRRALDTEDAGVAVDRLLAEGVDAIAICLINAFANPVHERALEALVKERAPGCAVSISYDVLPEIKEYERTSTTVINTYISPIVRTYLERLGAAILERCPGAHLLIMQSNGGLTSAEEASRRPVNIVESGPAGGVVGALAMAADIGQDDLVTFDMGGTTAKAALIEGGVISRSSEFQVGGGILTGSRLMTGAGYLVRMPAIDLAEVGAGGGSLIAIDAGGSMQVGPESAGAEPGPVCYDQGGREPTITDANVALGYLNPDYLVGGALSIDSAKAIDAMRQQIAEPLGVSVEEAAYGAHRIVASNMIRAIRAVSTERGRDPRGYTLVAFGGNGPVFGAAMAQALAIGRVVVPPAPGLFSSFGLLTADVEHHLSRTFRALLRGLDKAALNAAWDALAEEAMRRLAADGYGGSAATIERHASLHYQGQTYELTVAVPDGPLDDDTLAVLEEAFGAEHERTYGHRAGPEEPVELVTLRVLGRGRRPRRPAAPHRPCDRAGAGVGHAARLFRPGIRLVRGCRDRPLRPSASARGARHRRGVRRNLRRAARRACSPKRRRLHRPRRGDGVGGGLKRGERLGDRRLAADHLEGLADGVIEGEAIHQDPRYVLAGHGVGLLGKRAEVVAGGDGAAAGLVGEKARPHDGVVEAARLQVPVGDGFGPEIVMQAFGPAFRRIDGDRAQHDEAAGVHAHAGLDEGHRAVLVHVDGLLRPGLGAGAGGEDGAPAAAHGIAHRLFEIADPAFRTERLQFLALGDVPDHGDRLVPGVRQHPQHDTPGEPVRARNHNLHRRLLICVRRIMADARHSSSPG